MKTLKALAVAVLVLGMSGCDAFLDVNVNPDTAEQVPPAELFLYPIIQWSADAMMTGDINATLHSQIWGANASGTTGLGNFSPSERGYPTGLGAPENVWTYTYTALGNLNELIRTAEEAEEAEQVGYSNQKAQARIMMAYMFYRTTMLYERIPFTEALQILEFPMPRFDEQDQVLRGVIAMVDQAISEIDPAQTQRIWRQDPIFGQFSIPRTAARQLEQWERFGNSLKLLAWTALRGGGAADAPAAIDALIAQDRLITSAADNAYIPYDATTQNPRSKVRADFANHAVGGGAIHWFWAGGPSTAIMNATEDPRRPLYMNPVATTGAFVAPYVDASIPGIHAARAASNIPVETYLRPSMPHALLTADEVHFLIAEQHARQGRLGEADVSYQAGVNAAFDALPVMAGQEVSGAEQAAFIAGLPTLTALNQTEALYEIVHQHYVALWHRGYPSWELVRRVGEHVFGLVISPTLHNPELSTFLRRVSYPSHEAAANPNLPADPPLDQPQFFMNADVLPELG
jgi:hypothetical protein